MTQHNVNYPHHVFLLFENEKNKFDISFNRWSIKYLHSFIGFIHLIIKDY